MFPFAPSFGGRATQSGKEIPVLLGQAKTGGVEPGGRVADVIKQLGYAAIWRLDRL